ncbi:MAG: hypothetical protein ACYC8T_04225 [Myxococcaceae bacterium]
MLVAVWAIHSATKRLTLTDVTVTSVGIIDVPIVTEFAGQLPTTTGHERQTKITVSGMEKCLRGKSLGADLQVGDRLETVTFRGCLEGPCDCIVDYRRGAAHAEQPGVHQNVVP